jgi:hypothetical protein
MPFYAHASPLISPGDIFPEIPISVSVPPLRVVRKSKFSPKAKFGPQDIRRIFTLPQDIEALTEPKLKTQVGEETLTTTRVGLAMFLSWGSQVEADERDIARRGDPRRKGWLAAPVYRLQDIPETAVLEDPETHERILIRDVVRNNSSHNYFYLPPFPSSKSAEEYYVDFRKISSVGMAYFTSGKNGRLVALTEESLNMLFSRLMWFFTRAEYFFQPVRCKTCGVNVPIDVRFEGQNLDAEPWQ